MTSPKTTAVISSSGQALRPCGRSCSRSSISGGITAATARTVSWIRSSPADGLRDRTANRAMDGCRAPRPATNALTTYQNTALE